jgi:hypothetical protein
MPSLSNILCFSVLVVGMMLFLLEKLWVHFFKIIKLTYYKLRYDRKNNLIGGRKRLCQI